MHKFTKLPPTQLLLDQIILQKEFDRYKQIFEAGRNPQFQSEPNSDEIIKAIERRNYVGVYYEEEEDIGKVLSGFRLIEPYVYGKGFVLNGDISFPGREYVRVFVIKDSRKDSEIQKRKDLKGKIKRKSVSKSNRKIGWRLMRVDRIKAWQNLNRKFVRYREFYNPDDKMINTIISSSPKSDFRGEATNKFA